MRRHAAVAAFLAVLATGWSTALGPPAGADAPAQKAQAKWGTDLDAALRRAKADGKALAILFR